MDRETQRQIFHLSIGLLTLLLLMTYGRGLMLAIIFFIIIIGTLLINARIMNRRIFFVEWFEQRLERTNAPFPGWGSACYAAGALILLTFLRNTNEIATGLVLLGIGDAFSTIIGRLGQLKLPYNPNKTIDGMFGFFLASLVGYAFIGDRIIALSLLGAIAESLPTKVDDNIVIPLTCVLYFSGL